MDLGLFLQACYSSGLLHFVSSTHHGREDHRLWNQRVLSLKSASRTSRYFFIPQGLIEGLSCAKMFWWYTDVKTCSTFEELCVQLQDTEKSQLPGGRMSHILEDNSHFLGLLETDSCKQTPVFRFCPFSPLQLTRISPSVPMDIRPDCSLPLWCRSWSNLLGQRCLSSLELSQFLTHKRHPVKDHHQCAERMTNVRLEIFWAPWGQEICLFPLASKQSTEPGPQ